MHLVAFGQQEFGEISAVLPMHTGNQGDATLAIHRVSPSRQGQDGGKARPGRGRR